MVSPELLRVPGTTASRVRYGVPGTIELELGFRPFSSVLTTFFSVNKSLKQPSMRARIFAPVRWKPSCFATTPVSLDSLVTPQFSSVERINPSITDDGTSSIFW